MPLCTKVGCNLRQAILNPRDLCKTCFAAQAPDDPLKDLDLTKPLKNVNLGELVEIFKSLMIPIQQKLENMSKQTIAQDAKITLLEANIKDKDKDRNHDRHYCEHAIQFKQNRCRHT